MVVESLGLSSSNYSFCMLWSLSFSNPIPSLMYHNNQTFTSDGDIAFTFNFCYTSVFAQKRNFVTAQLTKFAATISIADLYPCVFHNDSMLWKCDDNNSMGSDLLPSFVLHSASRILAPFVCELFSHILTEQTCPDI